MGTDSVFSSLNSIELTQSCSKSLSHYDILAKLESIDIKDAIAFIVNTKPSESLPKSVTERSVFVFDCTIHEQKDILADDNGRWCNYAHKSYLFRITNINDKQACKIQILTKKSNIDGKDVYKARKYFYRNYACPDLQRKFIILTSIDGNGNHFSRCLLCYYNKTTSTSASIQLPLHGNSKFSTRSYLRTEESTLKKVRIFEAQILIIQILKKLIKIKEKFINFFNLFYFFYPLDFYPFYICLKMNMVKLPKLLFSVLSPPLF